MYKKAGLNGQMVMIMVALVAAIILIFGNTTWASKLNWSAGSVITPTQLNLCERNFAERHDIRILDDGSFAVTDEFDKDNNGVIDNCQVCFLELTTKQYNDIKKKETAVKGLWMERNIAPNSGNDADIDHDAILDACDSNTDKKAKKWLGFIGDTVISECEKIQFQSGDEGNRLIIAEVRKDNQYTQCVLKYNE